jgi:SAM-dependent methyltransferase
MPPASDMPTKIPWGTPLPTLVLSLARRMTPRPASSSGYGGAVSNLTRWVTDHDAGHSRGYIERFRRMAADGADLAGEARLVDAMIPRGSRILDAGCGPGRVGAELAAHGHEVVGVDVDPEPIEAANTDHPGSRWLVADLAELDLATLGETEPFDAAVIAGNVPAFVAPGTDSFVLARVADHVHTDGVVIVGSAWTAATHSPTSTPTRRPPASPKSTASPHRTCALSETTPRSQ